MLPPSSLFMPAALLCAAPSLPAAHEGHNVRPAADEQPAAHETEDAGWVLSGAPMAPGALAYVANGRVFVQWSAEQAPVALVGLPPLPRPLDLRGLFLSPRRLILEVDGGGRWIAVATRSIAAPWARSQDDAAPDHTALDGAIGTTSAHEAGARRATPPPDSSPGFPLRRFHRPRSYEFPTSHESKTSLPAPRPPPAVPSRARWRDLGLKVSLWLHTLSTNRRAVRRGVGLPPLPVHEVAAGITLSGRWRPRDPMRKPKPTR